MTSYLHIDWMYGRPTTGAEEDEARALAAARRVLDKDGNDVTGAACDAANGF